MPPNNSQGQFSSEPLPSGSPPSSSAVLRGDELNRYVAGCLKRGVTQATICDELVAMGYDAKQVEAWVEQFAAAHKKASGLPRFPGAADSTEPNIALPASASDRGREPHMWIGGVVCAIGIFITVSTYSAAQQNGGAYYIAPGLIVWGAIEFCLGLYRRVG